MRYSGQRHHGPSGKLHEAKKVGETCGNKCKLRCSEKFNNEKRQDIFNIYWGYQDKVAQQLFLSRHVVPGPSKRKRRSSDKKDTMMQYFFYSDQEKVQVCRVFFLQTLDLKKDVVYRLMKDSTDGKVKAGTSSGGPHNTISPEVIDNIKRHIKSFPVVDSHYCRSTSKRKYLYPGLSVKKMYDLYKTECKEKGQRSANIDRYYRIFNFDFNLGFFRPKKDQCEKCTAFKNTKNHTETEKQTHYEHMTNKTKARLIKDQGKTQSKNEKNSAAAFDFEQILTCPHGKSSLFYYKRKLGIYNFTMYDYEDKHVYCYMWPEFEGGRGSNEVASCI